MNSYVYSINVIVLEVEILGREQVKAELIY